MEYEIAGNSRAIDLILNAIANEELVFLVNVHEIVFNAPHLFIVRTRCNTLPAIGSKRLEIFIECTFICKKITNRVSLARIRLHKINLFPERAPLGPRNEEELDSDATDKT